MQLVDARDGVASSTRLGPAIESLGRLGRQHHGRGLPRSAARSAFIGSVADDQFGQVFGHDIRTAGVTFDDARRRRASAPTGRCLILVTPDGQRTMNTFLGVSPSSAAARSTRS